MIAGNIKKWFCSCRPDNYLDFSKYKKIIWNILFISLLFSIFLTVFFQIPFLAEKSINHVADIIWIVDLVLLLIFDYKVFIDRIIKVCFVVVPFSLYLLVGAMFKQPAFTGSSLTKAIYLSIFVMTIWLVYSPLFKISNLKLFMIIYILAAILLALIVYIDTLRGADISSPYYAYRSKNSTGPIIFVAIVFSYFLLNKKKFGFTITRYLLYAFFIVIIALMKCRTVLIFLPFALIYLFRLQYKSDLAFIILIITIISIIALLFLVPYFRDNILFNILLNGKQNASIDDIFSGRLSIIYYELTTNTNYIFGNFSTYFDCMPLLLVVNYGFVGFLLFLPIIVLPFFLFANTKRVFGKKSWVVRLQLLFLISFYFFSIFEGLVPFGPGAETFVFWLVLCCTYRDDVKATSKIEIFFSKLYLTANKVASKKVLTTSITSMLYGGLLFFILSTSVFNLVSSSVFDILPIEKATIAYIQPKSISINGPDEICVGQRVSYEAIFNPSNTTDKGTRWDTWASNNEIDIDKFSGLVTAKKVAKKITIIGQSSKSYTTVGKKMISIVEPEKYNFSSFKIHNEEERFSYKKGETTQILFDKNYMPQTDLLTFLSSDENIATVDENGIVRFINEGDVQIYSVVNNEYLNESNRLIFNVDPLGFIPSSSISINIPNNHYQFEPLDVAPLFNDDATDKHYEVSVSGGSSIFTDDSKIVFLEQGTYQITIRSRNNPSLSRTKSVDIISNLPESIHYYGDTLWKVGRMEKLDLRIKYANGFERQIFPSDIVTTNNDYNKRAWISKNGLCADELSAIAITSGMLSVDFALKQNPNISIDIDIKCSRFSFSDYCHYINIVGAIIALFIAFVFLLSSFLNELPINKYLLVGLYFLLYLIASFVLMFKYSLSFLLLIPFSLLLLVYVVVTFILLSKKGNLYIEIFCESVRPNNCPALINAITSFYELNI